MCDVAEMDGGLLKCLGAGAAGVCLLVWFEKLRRISDFKRNSGEMTHVLLSGRPSQPPNKRQQLVKTHSSHLWDSVHNVLQFQASVLEFPLCILVLMLQAGTLD